VIRRIQK